jgi:hypothetical protein
VKATPPSFPLEWGAAFLILFVSFSFSFSFYVGVVGVCNTIFAFSGSNNCFPHISFPEPGEASVDTTADGLDVQAHQSLACDKGFD